MTSTGAATDGLSGLPPDEPCPDCEAPAYRWCFAWCPRYHEDPGPTPAETGDDPDAS